MKQETAEEAMKRNFLSDPEYKEKHWEGFKSFKAFRNILAAMTEYANQFRTEPPPVSDAVPFAEWISVKDRLPTEGGRYWCYIKELNDLGFSYFQWNCCYDEREKRFTDSTLTGGENVTHWMTLPKPPKEKDMVEPATPEIIEEKSEQKLRWVKASDRLPHKNGDYVIRKRGIMKIAYFTEKFGWEFTGNGKLALNPLEYEWLEEKENDIASSYMP
jgi:hypothetical protein